jgi:ATP-dependent Clp protease ATP-binding subunit ClpB
MTSNIGSDWIQELTDKDEIRKKIGDALKLSLRPEFLNRIDEVVIFNQLTMENIERIVDIQLEYLRKRLEDRHIGISLSEGAKKALAIEGFDPVYGARPLKRAIQRQIGDPLALKVLEGEFKEGDLVSVDAKDGKMVFVKEKAGISLRES